MKTLLLSSLIALLGSVAMAQYTNKSSVLDGFGTSSSGGAYAHVSAAAQPGGIAQSVGGGYVNQAGFLQTFFMMPGLDTDGDGVPDEADTDNDGDTLADPIETEGSAFNPSTATDVNNPDTDGDGAPDGHESVAGTDPTDPSALLEIVSIASAGGGRTVTWTARSNKTYIVRYAAEPTHPITNILTTVTAAGTASPPWYVTMQSAGDTAAPVPTTRVYAVQVLP